MPVRPVGIDSVGTRNQAFRDDGHSRQVVACPVSAIPGRFLILRQEGRFGAFSGTASEWQRADQDDVIECRSMSLMLTPTTDFTPQTFFGFQ
jgi:hypothetical protein